MSNTTTVEPTEPTATKPSDLTQWRSSHEVGPRMPSPVTDQLGEATALLVATASYLLPIAVMIGSLWLLVWAGTGYFVGALLAIALAVVSWGSWRLGEQARAWADRRRAIASAFLVWQGDANHRVGQSVEGNLWWNTDPRCDAVCVTLTCYEPTDDGLAERYVHTERLTLHRPSQGGPTLSFTLGVPAHVPPTEPSRQGVQWSLRIGAAPRPGVFDLSFPVVIGPA